MAALHKNAAVTRTISAGNCTGTSTESAPETTGLPFARRHSSAGIRALMWATASACSFGSSLGSETRGSKSIRSNVVTPDSIPQFTIPKLALEDTYRSRSNEKERQSQEGEGWGSFDDILEPYHPHLMSSSLSSSLSSTSSSGFGLSPGPGRKVLGDHVSLKRVSTLSDCGLTEAEHCSDPASRAALSLPHLPKVTTPYGFVTLSRSPQMASEEALLFQSAHRRSPEEISSYRHPRLEMKRSMPVRTSSIQIQTPPHSPACQRFCRSQSVTETEIQRQLPPKKEPRAAPASQSPASQSPASKSKRSLWGILRKHLRNQKETVSISI